MTDRQKLLMVWPVAGFFVALAFGIGVIATAAYQSTNPFSTAPVSAETGERIEVELGELFIEPAVIRAPDGKFTLEVRNGGAAHHDFAIPELGLSTPMLAAGESYALAVDAPAGTYEFLCEVPGHADGGMRGTLQVGGDATGDSAGTHDAHAQMTPEEMAEMDAAVVAQFPAETEGKGGELLEHTISPDGTKVFELTASEIEWETEPGVTKTAYAYNEMVPGPRIEAELGDRVRVVLNNELPEPTVIHFHGLKVPNSMDGVAAITQDAILPGESFSYEFRVRNSGSHMYHSHFMADRQVPMGLLGAFIVADPDDPPADVDYTMVLNDGPLGYTVNGKGFPATEPLAMRQGETARIRYMNEGLQIHPMHTHGMAQRVIAKDGYPLPAPHLEDNVLVSPGDRVDVIIEPEEPGVWAWHCHILTHAEAPEGMFGMVTAVVVE